MPRSAEVRGIWLVAVLLLAAIAGAPSSAVEASDYAYLFVQGRLTSAGEGRPVPGATLTLTRGTEQFEAVTDAKGVFTFEKLPLATFDLSVHTADGQIVRRVRRFDTANLDLTMLELSLGRNVDRGVSGLTIDGTVSPAEVTVPDPDVRWGRLWKQALAYVGGAALLAAL